MNMMTKEPPITVLLGLPFHDLTLDETLEYCRETMKGGAGHYLVTANVDFTTQAYEDPDLKKIVFFADRVVCDGMPLVWLSRLFGHPLRERVAGSDMVPRLLEICGRERLPVYFFGSDLATLEEAKIIVENRYPGLVVAGIDSPPMGAVIEWDNDALCEKMRLSGAKLLLACLGCPKQERWIFAHHHETGIPLSIGCGASLDFITGKQKRAPQWMQKTGMEWFWRMSGNPARLVQRYGKDFIFLLKASLRQASSLRRRGHIVHQVRDSPHGGQRKLDDSVTWIEWSGELRRNDLSGAPIPDSIFSPLLLDASQVVLLDSSGLGRVAQLARACRKAGQILIVVRPSATFDLAVRRSQMNSLFLLAATDDEALELVAERRGAGVGRKNIEDGVAHISFNRPLDALYHDEMMEAIESSILNSPGIHTLVVDLKDVGFIDSRAVGGLIRAWKMMKARGGSMFLARLNPPVREIISLLRLNKILDEWKGDVPE